MKRRRLVATINHIARWERLNAKRESLSDKTLEILEYAERELIGPGMDRACKDGLLPELLSALRKRRKVTDSVKQVRAAYNALVKDGQHRTFRSLMKRLGEMKSRLAEWDNHIGYVHQRKVRRVVKDEQLPIRGKAGRPKQ
ncbi:MAG TPA: hypothetical protein VFU09_13005 [Candidatus Udaeobacter sp.]|nr:hypothetical protein [Candidatus Udaeobacter sp.]